MVRAYPFLKEEFSLFLKIMREDVDVPPEMNKKQAAVTIQKIWRGKRVRVQVKKIRLAVRYIIITIIIFVIA